jgi:glycosyltransferase involved in cell wall biosynthesis
MQISIVIPVYNKAQYLDRCFESILEQDFEPFEVVAVDDGSTDGSGLLCDQWAAREGRLRVVHVPNGGVTAARRIGVEQSRGRYVMFADADDAYLPGALKMMHRLIEESGADEVIAPYCDQHGRRYDSGLRGYVEPERLIRDLLGVRSHFPVLWSIIFRRELLDGCLHAPRQIVEREDSLMQIKCLMKHPTVFFADELAYSYHADVPNDRRETLQWIRLYDEELRHTLEPEWERYGLAFVGHQLKVYEKFIDNRQFHVLREYYRPLRRKLSSDIPLMDRIAILLPPLVAYPLIHTYKKWLKYKKGKC